MSVNKEELVNIFNNIASEYRNRGDAYRQKSFTEAAWAINDYKGNIFTDYNKVKINKIGKSSIQVIDDYVKTGQSSRLADLRSTASESSQQQSPSDTDKQQVIELFTGIHGVGKIIANELYNKGCRTLEDTWPYLTPVQKLGCQWYYHLKERIPKEEADVIVDYIDQAFKYYFTDLQWMACGSYRRGKPTVGDLDILVMKQDGITINHLVNSLVDIGLIAGHLSVGKIKYLGLCRLGEQYIVRRIDIMIVNGESWPYATLYFTGSQELNVRMRDRAGELGLRLNEYRLTDTAGHSYPASTEEDIFNLLNMEYLDPIGR